MHSLLSRLLFLSCLFASSTEAGKLRMKERKLLVDESGFEVIGAGKEFIAPVDEERNSSEKSRQGARRELETKEYIRDESLDLVSYAQTHFISSSFVIVVVFLAVSLRITF